MFENLTYKRKNLLLGVAAVLLVFIVYSLGVSKTIKAYHDYSDAKARMEMAQNAPLMAAQLERELILMDAKMGTTKAFKQNTAETLLNLITNYCQSNHAVLREFPRTTIDMQGDLTIETNQFVLEGNFATILKLIYNLEQKNKIGKVASVKYQLKKDFKTKEMVLTASVFIQNIKKTDHEK